MNSRSKSLACDLLPASSKQTFRKQRSPCPILDPSRWRAIYCLQAESKLSGNSDPVSNSRSKSLARDLLPASKLSGNSDPRVQFQIQVAGARSIACKQLKANFLAQRSPCPRQQLGSKIEHGIAVSRKFACRQSHVSNLVLKLNTGMAVSGTLLAIRGC